MSDEERRARNAAAMRRYRAAHPEKARETNRLARAKRYSEEGAFLREYNRLRHHAKVVPKRALLREKIAGRPKPDTCEICDSAAKIVFDHCHATSCFRGWVCDRCNLVLGKLDDRPDLFRKMADYLESETHYSPPMSAEDRFALRLRGPAKETRKSDYAD